MGTLKNTLLQQSKITDVSLSTYSASDKSHWYSDFRYDNLPKRPGLRTELKWADPDFFKMYNLKLVAGTFYRESDKVTGLIVNESFLKLFGIQNPNDVLGKNLDFWDGEINAPIVGVVKDFNSGSLVSAIGPVVMGCFRENFQLLNIKIAQQQVGETLSTIKKLWESAYPDYVFDYQFLDQKIESYYQQQNQLSQLYKVFAFIALFISCLGLYGLVSFMIARKTKEVGVRKVLGASVGNILYLFSKEFTILIFTAFIIAVPIAYYIMQNWLDDFAYRIQIGAGIFLVTIAGSIIIAWLTVGYNAIKAAITNPSEALRYE